MSSGHEVHVLNDITQWTAQAVGNRAAWIGSMPPQWGPRLSVSSSMRLLLRVS
jgi:hypothetical protein